DIEVLKKVAGSMAGAAMEAGVRIVAGDTKVVGAIDPGDPGLMINTSGTGFLNKGTRISPAEIKPGDTVIVSGNLGDHHAAIMGCRLSVENSIVSDNAPLVDMISRLKETKITIHAMRDVTRGGLATVLNEFSEACGCRIRLEEEKIPVSDEVGSFCGLLGLDPLYMGNEGKCVFILPKDCADTALDVIRGSKYGGNAAIIGCVTDDPAGVTIRTRIGGEKVVGPLCGEGLPRIC
ncbi:MAG: hydrogenase expression/formation protein HypE, partial [Lachnospiraceae bacterium]|nr:hydrogenase expression/formation protein HypE [Lachnospiraceae bacterium]